MDKKHVAQSINYILINQFDIYTTLFIFTPEELESILQKVPFAADCKSNRVYITFLDKKPSENDVNELKKI